MTVLILWYSRVRIEEGYLTKKKNNYCWLLASCNILFFVFQLFCNILTHVSATKRQEKYIQIPFFFSFLLLRVITPQNYHRPMGLNTAFPSVTRLLFEKDFTKVKQTSCYSKQANIVTGRLQGMKDLWLVNGLVIKNR